MGSGQQVGTGPVLEELVTTIRAAADHEGFGPEQVRAALDQALLREDDWLDEEFQDRHDEPVGKLYSIFTDPDGRWSMLVAVFAPGAWTPVHDHGAWAVVGTYRGREEEIWYRRLDDGGTSGEARLEPVLTRINPERTTTVVPDGTIHAVGALDDRETVSIHIYGTDITTQPRSTFDLDEGTETAFSPPVTSRTADQGA